MRKAITLGFFDGVHKGHVKIIGKLLHAASNDGLSPLVIAFDKAPELKGHKNGVLTPRREKARLLRSLGVKETRIVNLNKRIRKMSPESFFNDILVKKYNAGKVVVGSDFRFGRGRTGGVKRLSSLCKNAGIGFVSVPVEKVGGIKVSSSTIRNLLMNGQVERANRLLGRDYSVTGVVVKGRGAGRAMGFPTANLKTDRDKLLPSGVFAGSAGSAGSARKVMIGGGRFYRAAANIGVRPTFTGSKKVVPEIYAHGFSGNLLGKEITFFFSKKIRNEKKFSSADELKKQVLRDLRSATTTNATPRCAAAGQGIEAMSVPGKMETI